MEVHAVISQYIIEYIDYEEIITLSPFGELLNIAGVVVRGLTSTFHQSYGVNDPSSLTTVDYLKYKLSEIENVYLPYHLKSISMLTVTDPFKGIVILQGIKEAIMSSPSTINLLSFLDDQINSLQGECKQVIKNVNKLCRKFNQSVQRNLCEQKYDKLIQTVEEFFIDYPLCIVAHKAATMVKRIIPYCDGELLNYIAEHCEVLQVMTSDYHFITIRIIPYIKLFVKRHSEITSSLQNGSPDIELIYHYFSSGKDTEEEELVEANCLIKLQEVAPNKLQEVLRDNGILHIK